VNDGPPILIEKPIALNAQHSGFLPELKAKYVNVKSRRCRDIGGTNVDVVDANDIHVDSPYAPAVRRLRLVAAYGGGFAKAVRSASIHLFIAATLTS
jgi:hypothetical protein